MLKQYNIYNKYATAARRRTRLLDAAKFRDLCLVVAMEIMSEDLALEHACSTVQLRYDGLVF